MYKKWRKKVRLQGWSHFWHWYKKWTACFCFRWDSTEDEECEGRLCSISRADNVQKVKQIVEMNHKVTMRENAEHAGINQETVRLIWFQGKLQKAFLEWTFSKCTFHQNGHYPENRLPKGKDIFWIIFFKWVNLPVTISLSDKPGHFFSIRFLTQSASDLTTVSQTGFFHFFFSNTFSTLNVIDHTTVPQTGLKKNSVCETVIWSLTSRCKMS